MSLFHVCITQLPNTKIIYLLEKIYPHETKRNNIENKIQIVYTLYIWYVCVEDGYCSPSRSMELFFIILYAESFLQTFSCMDQPLLT